MIGFNAIGIIDIVFFLSLLFLTVSLLSLSSLSFSIKKRKKKSFKNSYSVKKKSVNFKEMFLTWIRIKIKWILSTALFRYLGY